MKRVGYDADTQRYTFQQGQNGGLYVGAPGARFGEMTRGVFSRPPCGGSQTENLISIRSPCQFAVRRERES